MMNSPEISHTKSKKKHFILHALNFQWFVTFGCNFKVPLLFTMSLDWIPVIIFNQTRRRRIRDQSVIVWSLPSDTNNFFKQEMSGLCDCEVLFIFLEKSSKNSWFVSLIVEEKRSFTQHFLFPQYHQRI